MSHLLFDPLELCGVLTFEDTGSNFLLVLCLCVFVCMLDKDVIQRSGKAGTCEDRTPGNTSWHGKKRLSPSGNSKSVSAEQDPGKKCRKADQEGPGVSSEVIKAVLFIFFVWYLRQE